MLPAFLDALARCDVAIPARDAALRTLIDHHLGCLVDDAIDAWAGLKAMLAELQPLLEPGDDEIDELRALTGLYWTADDALGRQGEFGWREHEGNAAWQALKTDIRAAARTALDRRPR
ncbi:hypothetical protein EV670_2515 [Rivibacter subsaxonicus]|uniref:Uncharacterized protein n=1 Tax=Rivibacter subsaxonicus TaxID=457575 RepID=A0A4Q7VP33_9BURK|nr:hypothetical protein EV670_2515 [Rivibacter subsaxonicus]